MVGCTTLLGIDGEYALEPESAGPDGGSTGGLGGLLGGFGGVATRTGGAAGTDAAAGGTAGQVGTGGALSGSGGASGAWASGGGPGSAGGAPTTGGAAATGGRVTGGAAGAPDAGPANCDPGEFVGRFTGSHKPSITFVGVSLVVQGDVRFALMPAPSPRRLNLAEALFKGEFGLISGRDPGVLAVPFSATMTGEYDCETRMLKGTLENGRVSDPNAPQSFVTFRGEFTAELTERGFTGRWHEAEANPIEPSQPSQLYVGSGEFTARAY